MPADRHRHRETINTPYNDDRTRAANDLKCYMRGCVESQECAICQEPLQTEKTFSCLPCGHVYHKACIDGWIKVRIDKGRTPRCPDCRARFSKEQAKEYDCTERDLAIERMDANHILLEAADSGWAELVISSLEKNPKLLYSRDRQGSTPLHLAANNGHTDIVHHLVTAEAEALHRVNKEADTALHLAAKNGHTSVVRLLLKHGAQVNEQNSRGETPLHLAAYNRHQTSVNVIVMVADVNVDALNSHNETPLYRAVAGQESAGPSLSELVTQLVHSGANVNHRAPGGSTPLYVATDRGHTDVVRTLVGLGADVNLRTDEQDSPLHAAAKYGYIDICKELLLRGALVTWPRRDSHTPLSLAAFNNNIRVATLLLLAGADPNTIDPTGKSLLFLASESGDTELVQQLLLTGASIGLAPDGPHGVAIQKGHTEVVELLEIYVKKRKGTPPMLWQLICENLLPLGTTTAYAVLLMNGEENRPREIFLGIVVPTKEGFNWFEAPGNDNMVYEYFEGQSGDGPLVLRFFTKHDDNQFAASVDSLGVALLDRGLHMRSQVDSFGRHVIAIYREHIKPTTMWWDENVMIEYESADTN